MELAETLSKNGLTVVGTVRRNKRFLPNSFKTGKHLGLYDSEFAYNGAPTVVNYQSKRRKSVILLSTMHDTGVVDRTPENQKKKPEIVLFYNATKGAVDTVDKMAHAYTVKRRTKRWPMVMFFNIIDVTWQLLLLVAFGVSGFLPILCPKKMGGQISLKTSVTSSCIP